ncbi:MAG: phosphatidylglycerophosphatase A [Ignavibacteriales bacterium CG_4_9_14_3_um_filter_34_10]|nr:MAG: phosphatidylglycerophosphatase A [Ignavibacteriales bacterium CG_4_9_14_3_um_filter_34_10]
MKLNFIENFLGSGFYTGYSKKASGTVASGVAAAFYLIPGFENPTVLLLVISFFIAVGKDIATKFELAYGKDPKECTIDEFIGTWISFLFLPKKIWYILAAFLIWRMLDIYKPFPANLVEKINGGWGILLDDIIAGFYTFLTMQLLLMLIEYLKTL